MENKITDWNWANVIKKHAYNIEIMFKMTKIVCNSRLRSIVRNTRLKID